MDAQMAAPMDASGIKKLLNTHIDEYLRKKHIRLGSGAHGFIENRVEQAAGDITEKFSIRQQEKLEEAKRAFSTLIDTMIEASEAIPNYRVQYKGQIGEETLFWSLPKLCPLWPICDD
jgi:hypothetical protein